MSVLIHSRKYFLNTCACKALSWAIYYEHAAKIKGACIHPFGTWASMAGPTSGQGMVSTHAHRHTHTQNWLKNICTQYSRLRLRVDLQGRYITLGKQGPAVKLNTSSLLREAKCSSKTYIEKNLLDCPASPSLPSKCLYIMNKCHLLDGVLADSLGK